MSEDKRDAIIADIETRYGKLMRKVAYQILNDWYEVEDVMQTVLWELIYKHLDKLELPSVELRRYLCTAAKNTAINASIKKNKAESTDPFALRALSENCVDMTAFTDQYGFSEEVQELLSLLDSIDADIIRLKIGCGYSYGQIAPVVGKSEESVRKRIERAKKRLHTIILDKEVEEHDR